MKVSIGSRVVEGPWGGGNLFVLNLSNFLEQEGHEVIYDLSEPDIDLIVLTDPRSRKESTSTYSHVEIEKYKKYVNNSTVVVQRINECDERKGTSNITILLFSLIFFLRSNAYKAATKFGSLSYVPLGYNKSTQQ